MFSPRTVMTEVVVILSFVNVTAKFLQMGAGFRRVNQLVGRIGAYFTSKSSENAHF